jgi:hypothetical protein
MENVIVLPVKEKKPFKERVLHFFGLWGTRWDRKQEEREQSRYNNLQDAGDCIITTATALQAAQIAYQNTTLERSQVDVSGKNSELLLKYDKVLKAQRSIITVLESIETAIAKREAEYDERTR